MHGRGTWPSITAIARLSTKFLSRKGLQNMPASARFRSWISNGTTNTDYQLEAISFMPRPSGLYSFQQYADDLYRATAQ